MMFMRLQSAPNETFRRRTMARRTRFDTPAGVIAGDAALAALFAAARRNRALAATVAVHLPDGLAAHLQGAVLRGDELTLLADSGAFATRIRFLEPQLRAAVARRHGAEVRRISVRVVLPQPSAAAPKRDPGLTVGARAALESAADVAADPELAAALRRLARR
jgi:hypothetical protein